MVGGCGLNRGQLGIAPEHDRRFARGRARDGACDGMFDLSQACIQLGRSEVASGGLPE